jgi:hypothetical protein
MPKKQEFGFRYFEDGRREELRDLTRKGYSLEEANEVIKPLYDSRIVKSIRRMLRKGFDYEILSDHFDVDPWVIKQVDEWPLPRYQKSGDSWRCGECGQKCETDLCLNCEMRELQKEIDENGVPGESETRQTGSASTYAALRRAWRRKKHVREPVPLADLPTD